MSEIRVNTVVAAEGTSAPNLPYGIQVPVGYGITGAGGFNITGVCTAGSFVGNITGNVTGNSTGLSGTPNISCGTIAGSTGTFSGAVNVDATTDSTSSTSGALIVDGGLGVAKNVYIGAGLSVAGTLTYEDVSNVDAVGLITAQAGVNISGGQLVVGAGFSVGAAGVGPFAGNITVGGEVAAATLDNSGNADIDGTLEADAYTVNGTALDTHIAGVTVTNATNSSHVLVTDNESTNESNLITFVEGATSSTGNVGLEMDGNLTYNPSSGTITATEFVGGGSGLTGITQTTINNNADNRLITGSGTANTLNGESTLTYDGVNFKVGTGVTIASTSGVSTFNADVIMASTDYPNKYAMWDRSDNAFKLGDSTSLKIGESGDLEIYHNGSHSYIDETGTGNLYIRAGTDNAIWCETDGAVQLYYDGNLRFATTNDGVNVTGVGTFTQGLNLGGMLKEKAYTVAGKLSGNATINLENGMVHYFSTNETTTGTPNIRWNGTYSLNNKMSTGEVVTVTLIYKPNGAGYFAALNVDSSGVTEEWLGGAAPSAANAGGYDVLTHTLIKTGNATFICLSNVQNFA